MLLSGFKKKKKKSPPGGGGAARSRRFSFCPLLFVVFCGILWLWVFLLFFCFCWSFCSRFWVRPGCCGGVLWLFLLCFPGLFPRPRLRPLALCLLPPAAVWRFRSPAVLALPGLRPCCVRRVRPAWLRPCCRLGPVVWPFGLRLLARLFWPRPRSASRAAWPGRVLRLAVGVVSLLRPCVCLFCLFDLLRSFSRPWVRPRPLLVVCCGCFWSFLVSRFPVGRCRLASRRRCCAPCGVWLVRPGLAGWCARLGAFSLVPLVPGRFCARSGSCFLSPVPRPRRPGCARRRFCARARGRAWLVACVFSGGRLPGRLAAGALLAGRFGFGLLVGACFLLWPWRCCVCGAAGWCGAAGGLGFLGVGAWVPCWPGWLGAAAVRFAPPVAAAAAGFLPCCCCRGRAPVAAVAAPSAGCCCRGRAPVAAVAAPSAGCSCRGRAPVAAVAAPSAGCSCRGRARRQDPILPLAFCGLLWYNVGRFERYFFIRILFLVVLGGQHYESV